MNAFELSAILKLDASQYEQGLNQASTQANSFGSSVGSGVGKALGVGVKAIAAAGAAVVGFGAKSVMTGMQFGSSMAQVGATMLKTDEEMKREVGEVDTAYGHFSGTLRDFALFMGKNTAFSASQASQALNYMALAGYDTQQSMEMLPNVMSLAAAGGMDLARASDMVTDTQTALGLSAERTTQMVDEMAKAASTGNTSVEQLGDAFLTVGGLARELNGGMVNLADGTQAPVDNVQELEIALTAMANAGIKGSEAGTHMRNMLTKLSSPTSDGAKQLEALGVSVFDTQGKMRSLSDIFGDLDGSLGKLTQQEKIQAITDLFNARDLSSAEALLSAVGQDWDAIGESILHAGDNGGAAAEMAKVQLDNLSGDMTLFRSALEGVQIAISDKITPSLRDFVQLGTEGLSQLTDAITNGDMSAAMDVFSDIFSNALNMIIEGLPQFVEAGVALLGALGQGIVENLPTLANAALEIFTFFYTMISENAPQLLQSGFEMVSNLANGFIQNLPMMIEAGGNLLTTLLSNIMTQMPQFMQKGGQFIVNMASGVAQRLPQIISAMANVMSRVIATVMQNLPAILSKGVEIVGQLAAGVGRNIPAIVAAITSAIAQLVSTIASNLPQFLQKGIEILGKIQAGIIQAIPQVIAGAMSCISSIQNTFSGIDWASIGTNIIRGVANGISAATSFIANAARSAAQAAFNAAKSLLGIKSPSKLFRDQVGKMIGLGMAYGIRDSIPEVTGAMDDLSGDLDSGFDEMDFGTQSIVSRVDDRDSDVLDPSQVMYALEAIASAITTMDESMSAKMSEAVRALRIEVSGREFGRLVRDVRTD